jgi:hypothetical protein
MTDVADIVVPSCRASTNRTAVTASGSVFRVSIVAAGATLATGDGVCIGWGAGVSVGDTVGDGGASVSVGVAGADVGIGDGDGADVGVGALKPAQPPSKATHKTMPTNLYIDLTILPP